MCGPEQNGFAFFAIVAASILSAEPAVKTEYVS
jgi:hypothetical protein